MFDFKREIIKKLRKNLEVTPLVVLTGPRQTGKTTLLRKAFPDFHYVSLDLPSKAEQAELQPAAFLESHPKPLIIDEVQYAPQLFRYLKWAIDQDREEVGQYLLTGSQKFNLMQNLSDSLAGRCIWMELEPLSLTEIQASSSFSLKTLEDQFQYLMRGQFPELWKKRAYPASEFYHTYLSTYIERDVRQLLQVSQLRDFERFIRVCASQNGGLLNKTELAKGIGMNVKTVSQWLSVLEASGILFLLEPYFENFGKRVVKSPKLYFGDTGLLSFLLGIQGSIPESLVGTFFETHVFAELRKAQKNRIDSVTTPFFFYRDDSGFEIDFVQPQGKSIRLFECKWTERPQGSEMKNLQLLIDQIKGRVSKKGQIKKGSFIESVSAAHLVCRAPESYAYPHQPEIQILNGFSSF